MTFPTLSDLYSFSWITYEMYSPWPSFPEV